jgi:hypothetical protein
MTQQHTYQASGERALLVHSQCACLLASTCFAMYSLRAVDLPCYGCLPCGLLKLRTHDACIA